jgi:hypothetical protein
MYSGIIDFGFKDMLEDILQELRGFRARSCVVDGEFTLTQLINRRGEYKMETHIGVKDNVMVFDKFDRLKLWTVSENTVFPFHSIFCGYRRLFPRG